MREILFRGKRVDNGEWVYGSLLIQSGECLSEKDKTPDEYWIYGKQGEHNLVIYKTVGQYTGKKDTHNYKIFEGDIVSEKYYQNKISYLGFVKYNEELTCFDFIIGKNPIHTLGSYANSESYTKFGNIYDNPELLEVE